MSFRTLRIAACQSLTSQSNSPVVIDTTGRSSAKEVGRGPQLQGKLSLSVASMASFAGMALRLV